MLAAPGFSPAIWRRMIALQIAPPKGRRYCVFHYSLKISRRRFSFSHSEYSPNQLHQCSLLGMAGATFKFGDGPVQNLIEDAAGERVHRLPLLGRQVVQSRSEEHTSELQSQ